MKILFSLFFLASSCIATAQQKYFSIKGNISGFPDGTKVSYYDRNTNKLDSVTEIRNQSFFIKGQDLKQPEFRYLVIDEKGPAISLLLDNSELVIAGSKDHLDKLTITGSALQNDFGALVTKLNAFESVFTNQNFTPENKDAIGKACEEFVSSHPSSFVSLLAISQLYQVTQDPVRTDEAMKRLDANVKKYDLANTLTYQINLTKSTAIGSHILPFSQNNVDGKSVSISDFKGKYVLIDFWASWCRPCRMENPNVVANFNRFKNKNFTVLGVSLDQSKSAWESAIKMDRLTWTHVSDLKGWQNEVSTMFHITSIPQNILIDPDGVIIAKNIRGSDLGTTLEKVLGN